MTQQEYEQKRRGCWKKFLRSCLELNTPRSKFLFDWIFDRAYALGKEEKKAEEDKTLKVNRQLFCRLCADADDYINEHLEEEDGDYSYYQGRSDALHELYRGECKDADTAIQGWVFVDETTFDRILCVRRVTQGEYEAVWDSGHPEFCLGEELFPDMVPNTLPEPVEIIIKRKKNG